MIPDEGLGDSFTAYLEGIPAKDGFSLILVCIIQNICNNTTSLDPPNADFKVFTAHAAKCHNALKPFISFDERKATIQSIETQCNGRDNWKALRNSLHMTSLQPKKGQKELQYTKGRSSLLWTSSILKRDSNKEIQKGIL